MKGTLIFVYGTLRKGGHYHKRYLEDAEFLGETSVSGVLFSLGRFPGAHFQAGHQSAIVGEVYRVSRVTVDRLDMLEGYDEKNPERSMYVRRPVLSWPTVLSLPEGKRRVLVQAYEFRGEADKYPKIPHGDWLRYLAENPERR